jgi:ribosomal protein L21E
MSPHKALYGYDPRHVALDSFTIEVDFPLDDRVKALVQIHEKCKEFLQEQQEKRNVGLNRKRDTRRYEPGDRVKLRIHERKAKLSPFWKGPFKIIRKISDVNYEVDLPTDISMSRIIHAQHIRPWRDRESDLVYIGRQKMPQTRKSKISGTPENDETEPQVMEPRITRSSRKKMVDEEDQHLVRYNRPITRGYQKILDQVDREKANLISEGYCTMDEYDEVE